MRRVFLMLLLLLACVGPAWAAAPGEFNAANNLYDQGDFYGARAMYESLVQSGNWSSNLFYNLGNAAFRAGDKGAAFLAYERALALEPGHPEAKANLLFLRGETGARVSPIPWYGRALSRTPAHLAAWIAVAAFWGLCFSLAPLLWKRRAGTAPALFCAIVLAWSGAVLAWQISQGERWIVVTERAEARMAPADNARVTATLPMGSHIRLVQERGPWVCVQLANAEKAWVGREAVSPIRLSR